MMVMMTDTPKIAKSSAISDSPYKSNTTAIVGATSMNATLVAVFCNCDGAGFSVGVDGVFLRDLSIRTSMMAMAATARQKRMIGVMFVDGFLDSGVTVGVGVDFTPKQYILPS